MSSLNLSQQDLADLRCCKCKGYLSIPPITSTSDGFHCGVCVPPGEPVRLTIYEVLAKYAQFPCTFNSLGCNQQVKFLNYEDHESTCEFRTTNCPIENCPTVKICKSIDTHLVSDHADFVIKNPKLSIPQKKDVAMYHVLQQEGMILLLQIRTRFGDKLAREFDLALRYFSKPPTITQYTYSVKITSTENNKSLTIDDLQIGPYKPDWNYAKQDVESLDFNILQMLLASSSLLFEIVLDKSQTKPSVVTKKTNNNNTGDNIKSEVVSQKEKTAAASSGSVKEKISHASNFLHDLECIVCKKYMKPPIYLWKTGRSIYSVCKQRLSICPICKYEGARNFQLE